MSNAIPKDFDKEANALADAARANKDFHDVTVGFHLGAEFENFEDTKKVALGAKNILDSEGIKHIVLTANDNGSVTIDIN